MRKMSKGTAVAIYDPLAGLESPRGTMGEMSMGGGIEGAERNSRETALWRPSLLSPDRAINTVKPEADARTTDMIVNDGYSQGAVLLQKDSIVGATYRLNAKPDYRVIYGKDNAAAAQYGEELASAAEARFNLAAESEDCWFDAGGMLTFTGMIRLEVGSIIASGEALLTSEWQDSDPSRPFKTMFQLVSPARLSNRDDMPDDDFPNGDRLRRGIFSNRQGKPKQFHIRRGFATDPYQGTRSNEWDIVDARFPWGRRQVLFVRDIQQIDQSRGLSAMVAALAHCRMTKRFSEITLQNAVVNASFAAAIESELPSPEIIAALGGGQEGYTAAIGQYMTMLQQYLGASENIAIDGAKIPHLFTGTKLNMMPMGNPGGVGSDFEASLLRKVAAALGVSYSGLARDFTKGSYSSAKAEIALEERTMASKKKQGADRLATMKYQNWFEEEMGAGNLPLPPGRNRSDFYRPLMKDAYTRCSWIGTGRGQIDEMKETQAALLRIAGGLSSYEKESARLGEDYREMFAQRAKEQKLMIDLGLSFQMSTSVATTGAGNGGQQNQDDPTQQGNDNDNED